MKKLLFIILSTFVFTSCVTKQEKNTLLTKKLIEEDKEKLAAESKYFKSYPPQISFNDGVLSGEFSIDELNNLYKIIISKNKKSEENHEFQIKSCKVSWLEQDGTGVTKTLNRGGLKPIKTILANAKPGQIFTFNDIKANVFENKIKVGEYDAKESLTIIVK